MSYQPAVALHECPVRLHAGDCATAYGSKAATMAGLLSGASALGFEAALGDDGGEPVPLGLRGPMRRSVPPRWWADLIAFLQPLKGGHWGRAGFPVFLTGSNFCIDGLYGLKRGGEHGHARWGIVRELIEAMRAELGWGEQVMCLSHACVSAQLGIYQAARWLHGGMARRALVVSFDFVGPFVAAGFHSLKILNARMPAPYQVNEDSAIGLGDGMAYAVLGKEGDGPRICSQVLFNEMYHFTANEPAGAGFRATLEGLLAGCSARRTWVKGHGTGTLEAGRLEAEAVARALPEAPLVSWKGGLGHTLGSCALVELVLALEAIQQGRIPGTVGSSGPCFADAVALDPFAADAYDHALLLSNAFGGAHAAMLVQPE
jgi:hypothetical protein